MCLSLSACLFKVQICFPTFSRSYTTPPFPGTNLKKTSPLPQKSPISIEDDLLLCTGKNRYGAVDGKKERKWQEMDLRYWTGKESKRTQKVSSVKFFLISWYKIMLLSSHFKWQCSSILLKKRWKRVVVIWFLHFFLQLFKKKKLMIFFSFITQALTWWEGRSQCRDYETAQGYVRWWGWWNEALYSKGNVWVTE